MTITVIVTAYVIGFLGSMAALLFRSRMETKGCIGFSVMWPITWPMLWLCLVLGGVFEFFDRACEKIDERRGIQRQVDPDESWYGDNT